MTEAAWALIGVVVGIVGGGFVNWLLQGRQFAHDKEMFQLQHKSAGTVKEIFDEMLNHKTFVERSFKALKSRVGRTSGAGLRTSRNLRVRS